MLFKEVYNICLNSPSFGHTMPKGGFFMEHYIAKKKHTGLYVLLVILLFLSAGLGLALWNLYSKIPIAYSGSTGMQAEKTVQTIEQPLQDTPSITDVLENVTPAVVGFSKLKDKGNTIFLPNGSSELGLGTGVIVSSDGYFLSNAHVTGDPLTACYVTLEDGQTHTAKVVWADTNLDLSLCKIKATNLPYCSLGDSSVIKVGETVFAVGNPIGFEFQRTVTSGIISAVDRSIKFEENGSISYMDDLIQTDATINPGNSGGPLLNAKGEMIGINTVKITSAEGINFAVPINSVKPVMKRFFAEGKFEEASLGVFAYDKNVIPYLDNSAKFETGIYIADVTKKSAAEKAGLQPGDIILNIDGKTLQKMCDLRCYIYEKSPGDVVSLTILRNKKDQVVDVTLEKK